MINQRILFVCTGNICRFPTAEGVFRKLLKQRNLEVEIPDPYYGGDSGFDLVLDMIEDTCDSLLKNLTQQR